MNYRKINNLVGWITFLIAATVYLMTMERTVSFWDCGEFISCAYKLEVGHSPGAPFFMMLQRIFGILAGGTTGQALPQVGAFINAMSALMSAGTILFLFWTITHMAKKLVAKGQDEPDGNQTLLIMGAGLVGGLAYTFSDTFWFSAVEGEVYATSSFFTALVFWAILKWENVANERYGDRWLLFISYMIGLSVGVHLLNLLAIPALAMVYYYKRYESNRSGAIMAFIIGCVLLAFVQFGVIQYLPIFASKLDLLFVNSFGLPFDSGAITFIILLVALLTWGLIYAKRKNWYLVHTGILCVTFIIIGFSSYLAPIIRSRADVPIDMTNPDNTLSLISYVQREQYGQQPLVRGQDFDSRIKRDNSGRPDVKINGYNYIQTQKDGKDYYQEVGKKIAYQFESEDMRFFPRIWDNNDQGHVNFYRSYLGLAEGESPTSADNLSFFFGYQLNWMWWRYFMWNYAGRENDIEGQGDARNGNWISGIKFLDKGRVGDLDVAGNGVSNNPARNQLYFLPLILGILGLVYQFNRDKKDGIVTFTLFFFTGIAIAIYLNMPPLQPRERDYAFAGSTYTFAIWIGLGVLMVNEWMQKLTKGKAAALITIAVCLLAVPVLMASEEWDDHDRSKKRLAHATAYNALQSCAPNAILFTFGDNDTYPLWYLQEVEGIRNDVRIINMSLLGIDWYIDQLNYKINNADAVGMIWKREHYIGENRNYIQYYDNKQIPQNQYFNLAEICKFIISDENQLQTSGGERENYLPTRNFFLNAPSKEDMIKNGLIAAADSNKVNTEIKFTFPKDILIKDDIAVLNIIAAIAADGWKRPIYFGGGLPGDNYAGLDDYLRLEGVVYRLMPFKWQDSAMGSIQQMPGAKGTVDVNKTFDLFMNKYQWGNAERNDVYFDEKNRLMFIAYRINSARTAINLAAMGQKDKAIQILDKVHNSISQSSYAYNPYTLEGFDAAAYFMAIAYYEAGAPDKGAKIANMFVDNLEKDIKWILTLGDDDKESLTRDAQQDLSLMNAFAQLAQSKGDKATADNLSKRTDAMLRIMQGELTLQGMGGQ